MIRFACVCGQTFEAPDDQAGDGIQCPKCMRLVDVPLLGDINSFEDDGTLKMGESQPVSPDLAKKLRTFAFREDLRLNVDEYLALDDVTPADQAPQRLAPRYDPETGELVEQILIRDDIPIVPPQSIPMAKPTLGYAHRSTTVVEHELHWWQLPWRLLTGGSLLSIVVIFALHIITSLLMMLPGINIIMTIFCIFATFALLAHYCNVIEEFGPRQHDSVPVMLRNASFTEDIWIPFRDYFLAQCYAFAPYIVLLIVGKWVYVHSYVKLGVFLMCFSWFPAALLTAVTSGSWPNLAPQRVLSVMRAAPVAYLVATVVIGAAAVAYVLSAAMTFDMMPASMTTGAIQWMPIFKALGMLYVMFFVAIYLAHLGSAILGVIYRNEYQRFNWVYQKHQKAARTDTNSQLEHMRRTNDPRLPRNQPPMAKQNQHGSPPPRR